MTVEQIPLIQKDISMITDKIDALTRAFEEERRVFQAHRDEEFSRHTELLEKLETKFAGKWTEKIIIFIGGIMGTAIVGALMTLILRK